MKKTIYQLACFLQEENDTYAISTEDFKEDTELAQEEILNLLTVKIGKSAAEDKLNIFKTAMYDQGYIDGLRVGAQLARMLAGETDTIKITEKHDPTTNQLQR
ncbi:hypothetical protein HM1_0037 [Heliomicrobium modesticaldum Ice1]|uniref:Uncharacterized protein n=1 Tax=Heliobacterium modesticaldum (strain ATCC 51547 / Ice1) TaxID=498761 RepID=B0THY9_HELMI|nr:hypothetical protein [Heliomicrobium modesticaldum]ABZ82662.1 hypothetical protein HM1_0037 [Heliomicrobium modesticaldum Ice1]